MTLSMSFYLLIHPLDTPNIFAISHCPQNSVKRIKQIAIFDLWYWKIISEMGPVVGVTKLCWFKSLSGIILILWNYTLNPLNHVHISQRPRQVSRGETCQVWIWYSLGDQVISHNSVKPAKRRNGGKWLSNHHPGARPTNGISIEFEIRFKICSALV